MSLYCFWQCCDPLASFDPVVTPCYVHISAAELHRQIQSLDLEHPLCLFLGEPSALCWSNRRWWSNRPLMYLLQPVGVCLCVFGHVFVWVSGVCREVPCGDAEVVRMTVNAPQCLRLPHQVARSQRDNEPRPLWCLLAPSEPHYFSSSRAVVALTFRRCCFTGLCRLSIVPQRYFVSARVSWTACNYQIPVFY